MNEDLALELGSVKMLVQGLAQRFERMERAIESIVPLDKALAEQAVRHEGMQKQIIDLSHEIKGCRMSHDSYADGLERRISGLERERNKAQGVIAALLVFSGVATSAVGGFGVWFYNRVETNRDINQRQEFQLEQVRSDLTEIKVERKRDGK